MDDDVKKEAIPDYTPKMEELEKCSKVTQEVQDIRENRSVYEKQWLVNIAFLFGKQYFQVEKKDNMNMSTTEERVLWEVKKLARKGKTQRVGNYILPLFRSLLSKMTLMKSTVNIDALTNSERDRASAKVAQEVAEDFWLNINKSNPVMCQDSAGMQLVLNKLFTYLLGIGHGYLKPYYNPQGQGKAYLENKVLDRAKIGCLESKVLHGFNVYEDPGRRFLIEKSIMHVDDIEAQYGIKVKGEEIEAPEFERQLISMLEGSAPKKMKNSTIVYEKWTIPSVKYPNGHLLVCTKKRILADGEPPEEYKGRIPYFKFTYLDFFLSPYAQGMVEQLVSLQQEYNSTLSRLAAYKKWMAGKVLVPRRSKLSHKFDEEVAQILFYDHGFGKPEYISPPNPPSFLMEDLIRIRRDMEDVAGSHDSSMGRVPSGVKSGVGIEQLTDLDNSQMAPYLMRMEQQLSFFVETCLDIIEMRYSIPRILGITGDSFGHEVNTFKGEQVSGNKRIKVSLGSSLPVSREARQQKILEWMQLGLITPDKARDLLEFGDVEGVFHNIDEQAEKNEIQMFLTRDDIEIVVEPYEDHAIRAGVLMDYMKSAKYMKLPQEIREKFKQHLSVHQQFLRKEAEASARMDGVDNEAQPQTR